MHLVCFACMLSTYTDGCPSSPAHVGSYPNGDPQQADNSYHVQIAVYDHDRNKIAEVRHVKLTKKKNKCYGLLP